MFLFGPSIKPLYHKCLVWPTPVCDRPRHRREEDEVILFHNCVLTPDIIRSEVDYFKSDFNNRIKQVLFNSLLTAYYMTFVPLCFAQVRKLQHKMWCVFHYTVDIPIINYLLGFPMICGRLNFKQTFYFYEKYHYHSKEKKNQPPCYSLMLEFCRLLLVIMQ